MLLQTKHFHILPVLQPRTHTLTCYFMKPLPIALPLAPV